MPRRVPVAVRVAVTVAALAGLVAGCGGSSPKSTPPSSSTPSVPTATAPAAGPLTITPSRLTPTTEIDFHFTAPVTGGRHGAQEISYSLSVTGPAGANCIGAQEATGPEVAKGARATITVGPSETHKPWCGGSYSARVFELARAHCAEGQPCPQYIRVVATVARASYRVTAG